ncbi:MAG TPA: metallophosphoesterase [Solirubrobacteraceae bacterium]|nr:metallophosphoesterase [Solirubrobacteraceae bacterium]
MRTLVVSDLHLGSRPGHDVLRLPAARERLLAALDEVDRLVLLGDTLELITRHLRRTAAIAEPVIREIGRRLGADREAIVVPGNHDAPLTRAWVIAQDAQLVPSAAVDPHASPALEALLSWLSPARARVSYPGVWLGERVWATHGHYLDRYLIPESAFGILRPSGRRSAAVQATATARPSDYERGRHGRRDRRGRETLASRLMSRPVATVLEGSADLVRVAAMPHVPRLMMSSGLAPVSARVLDTQMRHAAIPALAGVVRRLGIDADWVIFGHVHRRGPLAGEAWPDRGGVRFLNAGSWVYEQLLIDRAVPPHPYWPGGAVVLEDGREPRSVGLLDDLSAEQLRPRPAAGAAVSAG